MNTYQVFRDSSEFNSIASGYAAQSHQIHIQAQTQSINVPPLNLPKSNTFEVPNTILDTYMSSRNTVTSRPPLATSSSLDSNPCTPMLGSSRRLSVMDTPGSLNNFESTQDLRTFVVTVDLQKINRDRQNQLKLALEDNLQEKEVLVTEAHQAHTQMRQEHDQIVRQLDLQTRNLETEMLKQREHIGGLKTQAQEIKVEMEQRGGREEKRQRNYQNQMSELIDRISYTEREVNSLESELQIMRYEQQSTEQTIEIRRRVRIQELDDKIKPLIEEKEQIQLSRDLMLNNLQILQDVKFQNENEKTMISEDLYGSGQTKMELIYQREEIEQYIEKTKAENADLQFVSNIHLIQGGGYLKNWDYIQQELVTERQRHLLLDLIRELHQYILGMSSNTTDNSVMQSDELEELQLMIEKKTVQIAVAVELVTDFAQNKIKIDLTPDVLQNKLNHVCDSIEEMTLKYQLQENEQLETQMKEIDNKIKIITNRCQNELQPRLKALSLSETQINDQISKVSIQMNEITHTLEILIAEMSEVRDDFERTQKSLMPEEELQQDEQLDIKLDTLIQQIELIDIEVQSNKNELAQLQYQKQVLLENQRSKQEEYKDYQIESEAKYQQILEAIKQQKTHVMQYEVSSPKIQQLTRVVSQLKCDKESAYKRLKYIEARMSNAEESVAHAKQVLDNHILQIQQEQLHQKINQSTAVQFNRRKQSAIHQSSIDPLLQDSKSSQRIEMIPTRGPLQDLTNVQGPRKQEEIQKKFNHVEQRGQDRLHKRLIEPEAENLSKSNNGPNQLPKNGLCQNQRDAIYAMLKQDRSVSAADLVKYNYDSSAARSHIEDQSQLASSNRQPAINLIALAKSKNIPIQTLITPRENLQDMQYNHSHQTSIVSQPTHYELGLCNQFFHNLSIGSTDSLCPPSSNKKSQPFLQRQLSVQLTESPKQQLSHTLQQQHSSSVYQSLYPLPSVKISLRESQTRSIDDNQRSSFSSSINNFKENIAPNIAISAASSTMNMRKLSQATILSSISQNKPPAVPQGKFLMVDEISSRRQSGIIQKNSKTHHQLIDNQFNSSKSGQQVQTKMRMCQNSNNGKVLAVGIVDLSRCNQTMIQRDIQFFESIKPLIEGAQFLFFTKHGQCHAKRIFLDFSLLRLFITATSSCTMNADRREILMIENIVKPELPQSTLDLIKSEKSHTNGDVGSLHSSTSSTSRRYEFHLILNNLNGMVERMQLMTKSYDDLRLWIIGLNALIANKNNLMRLSTMIKS